MGGTCSSSRATVSPSSVSISPPSASSHYTASSSIDGITTTTPTSQPMKRKSFSAVHWPSQNRVFTQRTIEVARASWKLIARGDDLGGSGSVTIDGAGGGPISSRLSPGRSRTYAGRSVGVDGGSQCSYAASYVVPINNEDYCFKKIEKPLANHLHTGRGDVDATTVSQHAVCPVSGATGGGAPADSHMQGLGSVMTTGKPPLPLLSLHAISGLQSHASDACSGGTPTPAASVCESLGSSSTRRGSASEISYSNRAPPAMTAHTPLTPALMNPSVSRVRVERPSSSNSVCTARAHSAASLPVPFQSPVVLFFDSFYSTMFNLDPLLQGKFHHSLKGQGKMLVRLLDTLIHGMDDEVKLRERLEGLAQSHVAYDVSPAMYKHLPECMLAGIRAAIGDERFTPDVEAAWRSLASHMVSVMVPIARRADRDAKIRKLFSSMLRVSGTSDEGGSRVSSRSGRCVM